MIFLSVLLFIAADHPLKFRPNPYEKMISVNEALSLGVKNIPRFLPDGDFDRDKPNVIMICDRDIKSNLSAGTFYDGGADDDFAIWVPQPPHDIPTQKPFCAVLQWGNYTEGRALQFIEYLKTPPNWSFRASGLMTAPLRQI